MVLTVLVLGSVGALVVAAFVLVALRQALKKP